MILCELRENVRLGKLSRITPNLLESLNAYDNQTEFSSSLACRLHIMAVAVNLGRWNKFK